MRNENPNLDVITKIVIGEINIAHLLFNLSEFIEKRVNADITLNKEQKKLLLNGYVLLEMASYQFGLFDESKLRNNS